MRRLKKILLVISIIGFTCIIAIYSYFEFGGYFLLGEDREAIGKEIRNNPALPDNFINIYDAIYPDALNNNLWSYVASGALTGKYKECPCRDAAYPYIVSKGAGDFYEAALITFQVEDMVTQKECLAFVLNNMYFRHGVEGITNAAQYYYKKDFDKLNEDEVTELIVMAENPFLYNKERRPELVKKRVEELRHKFINK